MNVFIYCLQEYILKRKSKSVKRDRVEKVGVFDCNQACSDIRNTAYYSNYNCKSMVVFCGKIIQENCGKFIRNTI